MLSSEAFYQQMEVLSNCLPSQVGEPETFTTRMAVYYQALTRAKIEETDFIEACARALFDSDWFPSIKRLVELCDACARDRRQSGRLAALPTPSSHVPLVCPRCHGARWVRLGGASHIKTEQKYDSTTKKAIRDPNDRIKPCPGCTLLGQYNAHTEAVTVAKEGGVPDPSFDRQPDLNCNSWRAPRTEDGRIDLDAIYRQSRIDRGLDPSVDERVRPVPGFATIGSVLAGSFAKEADPLAF